MESTFHSSIFHSIPKPLVFPNITDNHSFVNILLIDSSLPQANILFESANSYTLPIIYHYSSSKEQLTNLLNAHFNYIHRIAFCFASSTDNTKLFLDFLPFFNNYDDISNDNTLFIIDIIHKFNLTHLDFLACNLLKFTKWNNFFDILKNNTSVIIGASNNLTGNILSGGDWLLENTTENIQDTYFNRNIQYFTYLLDDVPWFNTGLINPSGIAVYNGYLYVANFAISKNKYISKINIYNPSEYYQEWAICSELTALAIYDGFIYATNNDDRNITRINLITASVELSWVTIPTVSAGIAIFDGYIYVSNFNGTTISKINILTKVKNDLWVTVGEKFAGVTIFNGFLYTVNYDTGYIYKINLDTSVVETNWAIVDANGPWAIAIYNNYIYVTNLNINNIYKISLFQPNTDNYIWKKSIYPYGIVFYNNLCYVTNFIGNAINRFNIPFVTDTYPENLAQFYSKSDKKKTQKRIKKFIKKL